MSFQDCDDVETTWNAGCTITWTNGAGKRAMLLLASAVVYCHFFKEKRLGALNKFKSKVKDILVCTDVASRGGSMCFNPTFGLTFT